MEASLGGDARIQPLYHDQIDLSPKEIFQIKRKVHEVPEGWLVEFNQDVDINGCLLIISGIRAKEAGLTSWGYRLFPYPFPLLKEF
jgi:hypothetical protein